MSRKKEPTFAELAEKVTIRELKVGKSNDGKPDVWTGHKALAGELDTPGVDHGVGHEILAYDATNRVVSWKRKGTMEWSSIGKQSYYPTEIVVAQLSQPGAAFWHCPLKYDKQTFRAEILLRWTPGKGRGPK